MVRSRRPLTWWRLPEVVAAYQFVVAPSYVHMLDNVAPSGGYPLTSAAYPGWAQQKGATFNGSTQYLSALVPTIDQTWSFLIRMDLSGTVANKTMLFTRGGTDKDFGLYFGGDTLVYFYNGSYQNQTTTTIQADTVLGVAGNKCYQNGKPFATTIAAGAPPTTQPLLIGCGNNNGTPSWFCAGSVSALAVVGRKLSDAEMSLASHQMAYCNVNPDWSAWGRRRQYYYAPSAAVVSGNVGIYGKRGSVALPGGVRIEAVR